MKPESQTRVSAVTGMENDPQPSRTSARAERAERLRDYFDLQLRFAEAVAATVALPLAGAVWQCTNFYRRFGLGRVQGAPIAMDPSMLRAVATRTPAARPAAVWLL